MAMVSAASAAPGATASAAATARPVNRRLESIVVPPLMAGASVTGRGKLPQAPGKSKAGRAVFLFQPSHRRGAGKSKRLQLYSAHSPFSLRGLGKWRQWDRCGWGNCEKPCGSPADACKGPPSPAMRQYRSMSPATLEREYSPSSMIGGDVSGYLDLYARR